MKSQVREPEEQYITDKIFLAAKAAVAEELDRKRKLGLPIVVGGGDRVLVMIGDKVVEEIPYRKSVDESEIHIEKHTR